MTTHRRIGLKVSLAFLLLAFLLVFAKGSVDFVYTGF
jgi:hypothetical protein